MVGFLSCSAKLITVVFGDVASISLSKSIFQVFADRPYLCPLGVIFDNSFILLVYFVSVA